MPASYRVGVIGHTGRGNYGHGLATVWSALDDCQLVGLADADPAGLKKTAAILKPPKAYADYRQMLDEAKPHVVTISQRHLDQHRDMVLECAGRGIHMYLEKPMCRTLAEADEMVAACEKNNVKLALSHQTRYSPRLRVVKEMLLDGAIGEVLELRGRGKEDRRGGGEDLWVLGSHIMNLMHHLGGEPRWCFSEVLADGHPIGKDDVAPGAEGIGPLAGDQVHAMYGMDDGVTAYFGSHRGAGMGDTRFGLQIFGSKGVIHFTTGYLPPAYYLADHLWSPGRSGAKWVEISSAGPGKPEPLKDGGHHAGNVLACGDLLDAIENDRQPECSVYEGRTTVEMIAGVFESARVGGPVNLPLKTRENPLTKF